MLGAAMQKSPTPETIKPLMSSKDFDKNHLKSLLPESREEIKTTYSTDDVKCKEEDLVGGAGETVSKKLKKSSKVDINKFGKKAVSDKIPKKIAQRAKGTTSMNKPNVNPNPIIDPKPKASACDKISVDSEKLKVDSIDKLKSKSENQKPTEGTNKKFKSKLKKPSIKISKKEPPPVIPILAKANNKPEVVEPEINKSLMVEERVSRSETLNLTLHEEPASEVKEEPKPTCTNLNQSANCSFLERLQLGVKSYFSSRNSIICSDKNKKEGGNQTCARVGTEVKEDAQKTDPGFELKNNFCNSESGSLSDQLRLISNLGGESSNFLTYKTQISQNIKNRNLKNNVRIQIPRKGYFYRSSALSKTPEQEQPSRPTEIFDSQNIHKNKRKNQISRMAPTSAQIPCVSIKKRTVKKRKPPVEADTEPFYSDDNDSIGSIWSGTSNWSFPRLRLLECDVAGKRWSGKNPSLSVDVNSELEEHDGERLSVFEKSLSVDGEKKRKKNITAVAGDYYEDLEFGSKPSTLKALTSCISSMLESDELFNNLEITPVNPERDIKYESIFEESTKPLITSVPISSVHSNSASEEKLNPTAFLMEEIDLHLELQNYLKAFSRFNVSKTRTKNTLHTDKLIKSQKNEFLQVEEPLEDREYNYNDAEYSSGEEPDEHLESRLPRSHTQLPDIFKKILKSNSIDKMWKQVYLTSDPIDSYEKILPLEYLLCETYNTPELSEEPSSDYMSTSEPSKPPSKVVSEQKISKQVDLEEKTEIFYNVIQECGKFGLRKRRGVNSFSSYLIPLLNEKNGNKMKKLHLINFAKEISDRKGWKNVEDKEIIKLKMYVNMFQKIIKSPLSFKQIIYLNNVISAWESDSEEFKTHLKKNSEKAKSATSKKKFSSVEALSSSKSTSTLISSKRKSGRKPSKNLQMKLESFLNLEGEDYSSLSALKGKVLVDVKLHGNQIQVKGMSFLDSDAPLKKNPGVDGGSELIIENVNVSQLNNALNDDIKPKVNKQPKKNTTPKEKLNKKPKSSEEVKLPPQPEYDECQLRTQHPINPISEFPEQQITKEEKLTSELSSMKIKSDLLKSDLENLICPKPSVKLNESVSNTEGLETNLPLSQKASNLPKAIQSMVVIKPNTPVPKKVHKTPSLWSRLFFCYSALHNPQNNIFKKVGKEKNIGSVTKTKKKTKKPQKSSNMDILKTDTDWNSKNEKSFDITNMDFLFYDPPLPEDQKYQMGSLILDNEPKVCVDSQKMAVVPQISSHSLDKKSFSLDLIHSDSFLKQFSNMSILEKDADLLFQNFNFGPPKCLDPNKESNALTTFFLTPEQFDKNDLPNDDVLFILRKKLPMTFQKPPDAEDVNTEDGLSYEASDLEAMKKKRKSKTVEKKFCPPSFKERKPKTRCQTCQFLSKQSTSTQKSGKSSLGSVGKTSIVQINKAKSENQKIYSRSVTKNEKFVKNAFEDIREKKKEKLVKKEPQNLSKISLNLGDIPLELLEALNRTLGQVDILKKNKIMSAIERKKQIEGNSLDLESTNSTVLKSHCENPIEGMSQNNNSLPTESQKTTIEDLKEKESLFFDAVDKNVKDDVGKTKEEMKSTLKPSDSINPIPKNTANPPPTNTSSIERREKSEESLLSQISDCLVQGQISCSLLLLDSLMKRKEKSSSIHHVTEMVEENPENLISNLERSTWQVLMILEALTQLVDRNNNELLKEHFQSTKDVVNKILMLSINKLASFQKLNWGSQQTSAVEEDYNIFEVAGQCLKNLKKQMLALKGTMEGVKEEKEANYDNFEKEFELMLSKHKSEESDLLEIQKMKNKVVEELKWLEDLFLVSERRRNSSLFEETASDEDQTGSRETSSEDWLHRTYSCMHLMKCLLKVWDNRMSLNTYPSDFFR